MDFKFLSPYLLMTVEGLFGLIVTGVLFPKIISFTESFEDFGVCIELIKQNWEYKVGVILFCLEVFIYNILRMITNQRCFPAHRIIADCFSSFLSWIIHMLIPYFNNDDVYDSNIVINQIIKGIGYVVIFIGLMIFLEFILINKWGMNKN